MSDRRKANVSVLLKRVARAGRFPRLLLVLRILLPIISHAVKRFLAWLHPIICGMLLDRMSRRCHDLGVWSHCSLVG